MKRKFTSMTRVFRLFADFFDLNAIFTILVLNLCGFSFLHERFIKHDGRIRETVGSSCWDDDSADSVMSQVSALMPKLSINQATLIYVQTAWSGFPFGTIVIWNFAMTLSLININAKISLSGFWVVKGDRKSTD